MTGEAHVCHIIPLRVVSRAISQNSVYTLHVRPQDSKATSFKDEPREPLETQAVHATRVLSFFFSSVALGSVLLLSRFQDEGDD